ncbi:ubiquitin-conjugating enzyme e2 20 [Anaeramoeba ignava]|uniref:Ubiquitin-conjugating enzyme e2 20 n=1 Tax=Anaeramoeba ignava TaxID=1746090 RepID=A0A9Q0L6U5_ANAIG|nr:ubiquitin-conjugating enzyme e2 20 [Anaeramoeba ignava]
MSNNNNSNNIQNVTKRLQNELMQLMMSKTQGVSAFPQGDNILNWSATITAPQETMYGGLTYKLSFKFSENYPYEAPTVKFVTPCFHPNVDNSGNICLDILKEKWSAIYNVTSVLISIQSLLNDPNIFSPLNPYAAELWKDQKKYKEILITKYESTQKKVK